MALLPFLVLSAALLNSATSQQRSVTNSYSAPVSLSRLLSSLMRQLSTVQQQLPPILPTDGGCPVNWVRRGNSCYLLPLMKATWLEAHQTCCSFGPRAHLVSIHLDNKHHVNETVRELGEDTDIWIGLFRMLGGEGWAWTDGTPVDFVNWQTMEPNDLEEAEDCGAAHSRNYASAWNDRNCADSLPFLCQIKLPGTAAEDG